MSHYLSLSQLSKEYIFSMVQSMYHYEAKQTATMQNIDELLSDAEIMEFYSLYMGI
jgi:hypothetical protein